MKPELGDIVFYRTVDGLCVKPALVKNIKDNGRVDLAVFDTNNLSNINNVPYSETKEAASWFPKITKWQDAVTIENKPGITKIAKKGRRV